MIELSAEAHAEIDFSFLPEGRFQMESYEDGANANRFGSDYRKVKSQITKFTKLKIRMVEGGGWAARFWQ